jgi:hypothetical protein
MSDKSLHTLEIEINSNLVPEPKINNLFIYLFN